MTRPPRYTELGYPLANLPVPGDAVTSLDMVNTVEPLLSGALAILMALNVAFVGRSLTTEEASDAFCLLEGHLETALHILKRWQETKGINARAGAPSDAPGEDDDAD
jgi:hypothetical protein